MKNSEPLHVACWRSMLTQTTQADDLIVANGCCLVDGEDLVDADVRCVNGVIAEIRPGLSRIGARVIDAAGALVLPGIVDLHGDAFERQIMPRLKTLFPLDVALIDTDRQLLANGITTAFHGLTFSWEPGLRSVAMAARFIEALDGAQAQLQADHRLHIRWETFALDAIDLVIALFKRRIPPILAFNDHTTPAIEGKRTETKLRGSADRALVDLDDYIKLLDDVWARRDEVDAGSRRVAEAARSHHIPMLSHDDRTVEMRDAYRALGVSIAEFPMNETVLAAAHDANDPVVLGAPNVLRGGSHNGAIDATCAIHSGQCSILASDYYYPAQLHAALKLAADGSKALVSAWRLVSSAPAQAVGLTDRGVIAPGRRGDLVIVAASRVAGVAVAGKLAFQA
jgi:alpha-D-ribose 1-methylphosphonate 5-triphosphate diphosphatase